MAIYLDDAQRRSLAEHASRFTWRLQWSTWVLIVTIYGNWFSIALHARELGLPLTTLLLAVAGAWYMSLQHELMHGHPTRSPFVNAMLGFVPLAVWFPYAIIATRIFSIMTTRISRIPSAIRKAISTVAMRGCVRVCRFARC